MNDSIGPSLPPHLIKKETDVVACGPCLPPTLKSAEKRVLGPSLPNYSEKRVRMEETHIIGPLPSLGQATHETVAEQIENRAKSMKTKLLKTDDDDDKSKKRETWMTELPTERSKAAEFQMGLQARTFKKESYISKPKRDTTWTDTPEEKERKLKEGKKNESSSDEDKGPTARDITMQREVNELNKARTESLLDMHLRKNDKDKKKKEKKLNKEKKKKKNKKDKKDKKDNIEEKKIRVAFSRENDLQVNKFDDAKKNLIIKQSSMLNTRFSTSKSSKFL